MAKIAIIEDDTRLAEIYQKMLGLEGYEVFIVSNINAVETLRKNKPDLLLLDIFMPKVNGLIILEEIRRDNFFDLMPILMLTNDERAEDMEKAVTLGIHGYVLKAETSMEALIARIKSILAEKEEL
ncbi:MAG: response regulator [Candidatus Curtissbacteria bacterium]|nr:response regulator [Candidatus Curtissbacteria bacterium]